MYYKTYFLFVFVLTNHGICSDFKQQMAKILYYNPKYTKDVSILTFREGRSSPYLTTGNLTTIVPFGNNVTWRFEFSSSKLSSLPLRVEFKSCDGLSKLNWLRDWLKQCSNIPLHECPTPAGAYYMQKMEFPPKNFPLTFNNADYFVKLTVYVTNSKELILEITINLKANTNKRGK